MARPSRCRDAVRLAPSFVPSGTVHPRTVPARGRSPSPGDRPCPPRTVGSLTSAQQSFTATLSAVEDAVRFAFRRRLRHQEYEEALAEARAAAWSAWAGLVKQGQGPGRCRGPRDRDQRDPERPPGTPSRQQGRRPGRHGRVTTPGRRRRAGSSSSASTPATSSTRRFDAGALAGVAGRGSPGRTGGPRMQPGRLRGVDGGPDAQEACGRPGVRRGARGGRRRADGRGQPGAGLPGEAGAGRQLGGVPASGVDPESGEVGSGRPARAGDPGMARV